MGSIMFMELSDVSKTEPLSFTFPLIIFVIMASAG